MNENQIDEADKEYSQTYQLYNVISSVVEDYEGCKGGLRATEVWREVMEIEQRLPKVPRPDRFIASERSRLIKRYRRFSLYNAKGVLCWESPNERTDREVERSVNCVLMVLGMRLSSYPDNQPNPYEPICERIRRMLLQSEDLELLARMTNEFYDTEDEEEERGYVVPEEDVLKPYRKPVLSKELQAKHDFLHPIAWYFVSALVCDATLGDKVNEHTFDTIWEDLLNNEQILRELCQPNENLKNTMEDSELKPDEPVYAVLGNDYNLKLMMNLMGVMIEQGVVKDNSHRVCQLFFKDNKERYFRPSEFKKFGTSQSGFTSAEMYQTVVKIITDHLSN